MLVPAFAITAGLIVNVIESTEVHRVVLSVTVTKYFVVPDRFDRSDGLATVGLLKFPEGDQEYVKPVPEPAEAVGLPPIVMRPA